MCSNVYFKLQTFQLRRAREIDFFFFPFLQASFAFNCTAVHLRWLFIWHFQQHYSPAIKKKVKGVFPKCSTCRIKHGVTFHPARHILMRGALNEDPTGSSNQNDINHQAHLRRQSRPGSKDKNGGAKGFAVVAGQKSLCLQQWGANHISEKINLETHRI